MPLTPEEAKQLDKFMRSDKFIDQMVSDIGKAVKNLSDGDWQVCKVVYMAGYARARE